MSESVANGRFQAADSSSRSGGGFPAAWWLPGPHLQTVWGRLTRPRTLVPMRREILITPDDDDLVLDHLDSSSPVRFVLLHGLEGSSYSVYIQGLLARIRQAGHSATVLNFRSCAREPADLSSMIPNRRPRFYHSGETTDFDFVIRTLAERDPDEVRLGFGASLGGNVLLKWMGEHPDQAVLRAAVTASVPYDLGAGARFLENSAGAFYVGSFLRTLRPKVRRVVRQFPETTRKIDLDLMDRARTFAEFDDAATAPLHGFTGARDYYDRCSSVHFLPDIRTPTLCLSAEDDPFLPPEVLERVRRDRARCTEVRFTRRGGHLGFVGGVPWRPMYWAEQTAMDFLLGQI